jgi:hypothetical protein
MKRYAASLLGVSLLLGCVVAAVAQMNQPPKVLVVSREYLKPGRAGSTHEKAESGFVQAFARAKWPTHYLAMDSLSGKTRALFFTGYDSFEAWEKDAMAGQRNATLSAALEHAAAVDGDLLDSTDGGTWIYREDESLRAPVDLPRMRYFEISSYHVRPGHQMDWEEAVKLVKGAYEKGVPDAHWAMYENVYGHAGGTYVVIIPLKSAAEIDQNFMHDKDFEAAMGHDGMKKLEDLLAAGVDTSEHNLFVLNPRMSYVSEDWIKEDEFWKPKAPSAMKAMPKKAEEKKPAE